MTRFDPQITLLVVALENELPRDMAAGWTIVYTGVGKVNAAIALGDAIAMRQPKQVVNYGSAGALRPGLARLHRVPVCNDLVHCSTCKCVTILGILGVFFGVYVLWLYFLYLWSKQLVRFVTK